MEFPLYPKADDERDIQQLRDAAIKEVQRIYLACKDGTSGAGTYALDGKGTLKAITISVDVVKDLISDWD